MNNLSNLFASIMLVSFSLFGQTETQVDLVKLDKYYAKMVKKTGTYPVQR